MTTHLFFKQYFICITGLHYHLTETQVLELLQAFGKVKAFHLVKNEPDSVTSKGYCFIEFADPNSTPVAVMGLNGMDMGGGKVLTARVAGQRGQASGAVVQQLQPQAMGGAGANGASASVAPDALIVNGYEIEALVDAAMGLKPMPTAPTHLDQFGIPITKIGNRALPPPAPVPRMPTVPGLPVANAAAPPSQPQLGAASALPPGSSALDIANAALDAAFGPGAAVAPAAPPPPPPRMQTRILVLLNMVANEDLESDVEYSGLMEEVEEEVRKFGKLLSIQIPRKSSPTIEPSAVGKIFLEYATIQDSANAEQELSGRQFGPNVVQASYHDEQEYAALKLR
jgi:splicing factor U2AF subunit